MKKLAIITSCLLAASTLAACNTMEGFGQDMESAGSAIKKSADENNPSKPAQSNGSYNNY